MAIPLPDLGRAALLSMDLHNSIVSIYTKGQDDLIPCASGVLQGARRRGIRVIHVKVGFRPGLPEVSSRNALFGAIKESVQWQQVFAGEAGDIHAAVAPEGDEVVVTKHRVSAFHGTDLEMILRANEIDTLILMGIATSGVVLSTLLDACDADFRLVVVSDCCADQDAELHGCLVKSFFPRRATVVSAAELLDAFKAG